MVGDDRHRAAILKANAGRSRLGADTGPSPLRDRLEAPSAAVLVHDRGVRIFLVSWRASYAETRLAAAGRRLGFEARIMNPFEIAARTAGPFSSR
jgi:hypothetical protein